MHAKRWSRPIPGARPWSGWTGHGREFELEKQACSAGHRGEPVAVRAEAVPSLALDSEKPIGDGA